MNRKEQQPRPEVASADEDPNVESFGFSSPPCFAHRLAKPEAGANKAEAETDKPTDSPKE